MSQLANLFHENEEADLQKKIVEQLLNDENLDTKTELRKPLRWSCMNSIKDFIEEHKLPKSADILKEFINVSFKYLISNERKGRKEYIEALNSLNHGNSLIEPTKSANNYTMLPQ